MDTPLEESNLAHIGSDEDKAAREKAASLEVNWEGAGETEGIQIWRVENKRTADGNPDFGINSWPKKRYGEFYTGDSYIILSTTKDEETDGALQWDIFFWIGSESSQDEYGVAAYKANELDDLLGDAPVQHREIQGMESPEFMDLFPNGVRYLDGGIDSGFRHVEAGSTAEVNIPTRLFHVRRTGKVTRSYQVAVSSSSLNQGDAFVLDTGNVVYTWFGESASPFEKERTAEIAHNLVQSRSGHASFEPDVGMDHDEFWAAMGGKVGAIRRASQVLDSQLPKATDAKMYRVHEEDSFLKITEVEAAKKSLDTDDVFLVDVGNLVYIWVGKGASKREKSQALIIVNRHLKNMKRERTTRVSRVLEGQERRCKGFAAACA